jgi:transcriptional regulator with XRE-family HTH domain
MNGEARPELLPFAQALRKAMEDQALSPTEVARRVWGTIKDKRGYDVAKNRDRIGKYLEGTSYPLAANLQRLADAVNVPVESLTIEKRPTPLVRSRVLAHLPEEVELLEINGNPGMSRLRVNKVIPTKLAVKIFTALTEDPPMNELSCRSVDNA